MARVAEKISWARAGAIAAGREPDAPALEMNHWLAKVTPSAAAAGDLLERMGKRFDVDPDTLGASPSVLVGTVEQVREQAAEWETLGVDTLIAGVGAVPFHVTSRDDIDMLGHALGAQRGGDP